MLRITRIAINASQDMDSANLIWLLAHFVDPCLKLMIKIVEFVQLRMTISLAFILQNVMNA